MTPDQLGEITLGYASRVRPEQILELQVVDVPPAFLTLSELWSACTREEELQVTWRAVCVRIDL